MLHLSVSGLVVCPLCGLGAPVDPRGSAKGCAGHPALKEKAPPLAAVGEASSPE